ncbi:hypothetical protein WR25_09939 [Diploscapter pachys]|uniref:Uncharacterized protein n=1 Tax=Diploscapter pachys TaxID=2018661 RepID=A0A2A2J218_9BILA|nr:hypothetical protein WR25_09939 [Diploscapter pachys]
MVRLEVFGLTMEQAQQKMAEFIQQGISFVFHASDRYETQPGLKESDLTPPPSAGMALKGQGDYKGVQQNVGGVPEPKHKHKKKTMANDSEQISTQNSADTSMQMQAFGQTQNQTQQPTQTQDSQDKKARQKQSKFPTAPAAQPVPAAVQSQPSTAVPSLPATVLSPLPPKVNVDLHRQVSPPPLQASTPLQSTAVQPTAFVYPPSTAPVQASSQPPQSAFVPVPSSRPSQPVNQSMAPAAQLASTYPFSIVNKTNAAEPAQQTPSQTGFEQQQTGFNQRQTNTTPHQTQQKVTQPQTGFEQQQGNFGQTQASTAPPQQNLQKVAPTQQSHFGQSQPQSASQRPAFTQKPAQNIATTAGFSQQNRPSSFNSGPAISASDTDFIDLVPVPAPSQPSQPVQQPLPQSVSASASATASSPSSAPPKDYRQSLPPTPVNPNVIVDPSKFGKKWTPKNMVMPPETGIIRGASPSSMGRGSSGPNSRGGFGGAGREGRFPNRGGF